MTIRGHSSSEDYVPEETAKSGAKADEQVHIPAADTSCNYNSMLATILTPGVCQANPEAKDDAKKAAMLTCADDVLVIHESEQERAEMEADNPQPDLSPESANLIEELDRQLRDYDEPTNPKSKGKTMTNICSQQRTLFPYNRSRKEEEVSPGLMGICESSCITPRDLGRNNFGTLSHTNVLSMKCNEYMKCNTLCYLMDLVSYLSEGLSREKVSLSKVQSWTALLTCSQSTWKKVHSSTIPTTSFPSTTQDNLTLTNSNTIKYPLLYLLLLSRLSLSPPRPTTPSRPTARQIPPVTSRTDDVQGACVIRMYISVTYSARK